MSGPGGSRAPGAAGRAGRTLRRPPPPLRSGGLASPCARLRLSLGRRKETLPRALPPGRLYLLSSRPQVPHGGGVPARGRLWRVRGEEEAQGASSGDRDFSRAQPLVSPREEFPLYFTVVHLPDVSNNSLRVYRGFPSLLFIQKPGAGEAL